MDKKIKDEWFELMHEFELNCGIEWVSYGLAPRPWGYCYEVTDKVVFGSMGEKERQTIEHCADCAPKGFLDG